jgi:tetratricopeptide (TPR) repeat protein
MPVTFEFATLFFVSVSPLLTSEHSTAPPASRTPEESVHPTAQRNPSSNPVPNVWIYRPSIDLMVGCGAWSAPLLLLALFASDAHTQTWTVGFYFVALLFNYPHFMATVYRAYHTHTEFAKYRVFTVHIALLLIAAGVVAHLWYPLLPWIFTLYICWSPWHYTGQNFGLLLMFAKRSGISPTTLERRALRLAFLASFVMLLLSFHTGASNNPLILSLGLPARITAPVRSTLAAFFILAVVWAFSSLLRRTTWRAVFPSLLLVLTQFLWFLLPAILELATRRNVPQTGYSSGILAVLHSAQYLWITSYYQRKEARASGDANWKFSTYLLTLVAGGIALFIPGPWIVSRLFHADFAVSFLTFTALVNIHHFILDGALWKLRDTRIASFLVNSGPRQSPDPSYQGTDSPAPAVSGSLSLFLAGIVSKLRWFASSAPAARAARIVAVVLLFTVAAVDQLHFYWANRVDHLDALQRAASLNPQDSSVQLRLAHAAEVVGNRATQIAALRRAAHINPDDQNVQENLARGLIESGKTREAYAQYHEISGRWPRDVDALVNQGLLALQLENSGEAADDWQRAIAVDPEQSHAQLYLAQLLEHQGELQVAARHYRAYLQLAAAHPTEHLHDASSLLAVQLKVADADVAANHNEEARSEYLAAIRLAQTIGDAALESLALVHLAEVQEKLATPADAAQSYQRALQLDSSLADPRSAAADWLNYGQFLRRYGQSEELVFACLLHAQDLLSATPGDELIAVAQARMESEARLGRVAAGRIRSALNSELQTALSLPVSVISTGK